MSSPDVAPQFDISIELTVGSPRLDVGPLSRLAAEVMAGEDVPPGTSLAVLITDDDEIRAMNRQFLGIDEPTDVLAFPDEADDDFVSGYEGPPHLGDIAIGLPTAARQAAEAGHDIGREVAHLLAHGILHLRGFDHVTGPEDEARMRAREEHYLGELRDLHGHGH